MRKPTSENPDMGHPLGLGDGMGREMTVFWVG
jgi:hypothetical protein